MNDRKEKLAQLILNYLRKNPKAGDTLEGITRWWLELERIEVSVDEVSHTLEYLVENGLIRMHKSEGGLTFYKINDQS